MGRFTEGAEHSQEMLFPEYRDGQVVQDPTERLNGRFADRLGLRAHGIRTGPGRMMYAFHRTGGGLRPGQSFRYWRCLLVGALLAASVGCSTTGPSNLVAAAERLNLRESLVQGAPFRHRVYSNPAASDTTANTLHIYIDGDGTPWIRPGRPAADPTPRNPLVLRMMSSDPSPAVYLGRPCYAATMDQDSCSVWDWTHGRYAERVVESMTEAVMQITAKRTFDRLVLIGFSGGGTLAMLLAERIAGVTDVVTLAGNLDVEAWTRQHGYSALSGSLDPARRPPLRPDIRQWHWIGAEDQRVPPALLLGAIEPGPNVRVTVLPGLNHTCCWEEAWPHLLRDLTQDGVQRGPD